MRIACYLGSNLGNHPCYAKAVEELGTWIGSSGNDLVFGGSDAGTMGILASSVQKAGGKAYGVIPVFFLNRIYEPLDEKYVVETMQERKAKMIALADAFIALPGGPGTLEEISEIISGEKLGLIEKPYVFFNVNHYYDDLKHWFDHMEQEGFLSKEDRNRIHFAQSVEEIKEVLKCFRTR